MKNRNLLTVFSLLSFSMFTHFSATGQIFVKYDAAGAETGNSWVDAYTDLKKAISSANTGDFIWVAAGTYKPDTTANPLATFNLNKDLVLLGGFSGTEQYASERDPEANKTILSGDLNGDDVPDDFENKRTDNFNNVLRITANTTQALVLDGFTITGGHAIAGITSGGGMRSLGTPTIRNCVFEQNFATASGGGISQVNNTTGTFTLDNCIFQNNLSLEGMGLNISNSDFHLSNCLFRFHYNPDSILSIAVWIVQSSGTVQDCQFLHNTSGLAGSAMLVWDQDFSNPNPVNVDILNCLFEGNKSIRETVEATSSLVLVLARDNSRITLKGSTFLENNGQGNGGAVSLQFNPQSNGASMLIDGCLFDQNTALYSGSGVHSAMFGQASILEVRRCSLLNNTSGLSKGALTLWGTAGGTGTALVDSCNFEGNKAVAGGGLWLGGGDNNTTMKCTVTNSTFRNNEASQGGGAVLGSVFSPQAEAVFDNCTFEGNNATQRGGAFSVDPESSSGPLLAFIKRSDIRNNESPVGAAIDYLPNSENDHLVLENCLITKNNSPNGTISAYSKGQIDLLNCTVAQNLSNALELGDSASIRLQNTILFNPDYVEFIDLTNDATATSLGGNLISDNTIDQWLNSTDQSNADPLFEAGTYQLSENSPAVDAGVLPDNPEATDLAGNSRLQGSCIDIGAYESPYDAGVSECLTLSDAREVLAGRSTVLSIYPNPASRFLNLHLPENTVHSMEVQLYDIAGKMELKQIITEGQQVNVQQLKSGVYTLCVLVDKRMYVGQFVKL